MAYFAGRAAPWGSVVVVGVGRGECQAGAGSALRHFNTAVSCSAPGPGAGQVQRRGGSVKGEAGGDVVPPVAQLLGFGLGERASQEEPLAPADEGVLERDDLQPDLVVLEGAERQIAHPRVFVIADVVLDAGAAAVVTLDPISCAMASRITLPFAERGHNVSTPLTSSSSPPTRSTWFAARCGTTLAARQPRLAEEPEGARFSLWENTENLTPVPRLPDQSAAAPDLPALSHRHDRPCLTPDSIDSRAAPSPRFRPSVEAPAIGLARPVAPRASRRAGRVR